MSTQVANVSSNLVKSQAVPTSAVEMVPVARELLKRKSSAGEEYVFIHSGKNAEARLRDEMKRRLNLDSEQRLPDKVMNHVREAIGILFASLQTDHITNGYAVKSHSSNKPFVTWEKDTATPKSDGLRNRTISERELKSDSERLVCYQEERRKLAKRITSMTEKPGKFSREEIALVQARHDAAHAVCAKLAPLANS